MAEMSVCTILAPSKNRFKAQRWLSVESHTLKAVKEVELEKDGKWGPRFVIQLKPIGKVVTL